jgi:small subunit ribosomal protein S17
MTEKTRRKERVGVVVSNKMQKTVVVAVESFKRHRIYKKILRSMRHFKAHDEKNACVLGDRVRIVETRPLSKDKRWRVAEVLVRGEVAEVAPKEIGAEIIEELMPKAPPPPIPSAAVEEPEAPVGEAEAVEVPEAVTEEAETVEEPEASVGEAEAVEVPEAVAEEAETVEETASPAEGSEGEEERPQGMVEAEQPPERSEEASEAEEKQ